MPEVPKTLMHPHDLSPNWEESRMRSIAFVLATFVTTAPAAAQDWKEYSYPDYAFSVAFPAKPQVDTTTYHRQPLGPGADLFGSSSQRRLQDDCG
jgi:hypothetical protein